MRDFGSFDTQALSEAGIAIPVIYPDDTPALQDDGTPVTVTRLGPDCAAFRRLVGSYLKASAETGVNGKAPPDEQALFERTADFAADLTVGWSGIQIGGETVPFSKEKAKELFRRFPWLIKQVEAVGNVRSDFFPKSPETPIAP